MDFISLGREGAGSTELGGSAEDTQLSSFNTCRRYLRNREHTSEKNSLYVGSVIRPLQSLQGNSANVKGNH